MAIGLCRGCKWTNGGSWATQPMAGKPAKARQNGRGIWLYNAGICQSSSDFFSFSDDYKIMALRYSKPSLLNEPSQRIQTSLWSAESLLLSSPQYLQQLVHSSAQWTSLTRTPQLSASCAVRSTWPCVPPRWQPRRFTLFIFCVLF